MLAIHRIRIVWFFCLAAAVLGLFAAAAPCRADDTYLVGVGGSVQPLGRHPTIRMVRETVHVTDVTNPHVTASFVFKNEGPATDVLIGFPNMGDMSEIEGTVPAGLTHFRSFVDGKPIAVKRIFSHRDLPKDLADTYDYLSWYVKRVHFDPGQTHVILDEYDGGLGSDGDGYVWFTYVLKTGASWKGKIGAALVTVDLGPLGEYSPVTISPAGYVRRGSTVAWDIRNFKPRQDIQIYWVPYFIDISVNGYYCFSQGYSRDRPGTFEFEPFAYGPVDFVPLKRHHDIWLPVQTAANLLGAKWHSLEHGQVFRIQEGRRWVDIAIGSRVVIGSDGKRFVMGDPARYQRDSAESGYAAMAMVDLIPLVRALGGTAQFTRHGTHLSVRVPNKNAPKPPFWSPTPY